MHTILTFKRITQQYEHGGQGLGFPNCLGLMPKGPCSSLSSLASQKGNISPQQVGPQKTRLYLQRASRQHTISMQKHARRCTMEYIRTQQRSFVTPVPLQVYFCQSNQRRFSGPVKNCGEKLAASVVSSGRKET